MTPLRFRKVGSAYRCPIEDDRQALWLRRDNGRWLLLWEHWTSGGVRCWTRLGKYPTLTAGKAYALSLYPVEESR